MGNIKEEAAAKRTEKSLSRITDCLRKCEANMFAVKRLFLWMNEMRKKETVIDRMIDSILEKADNSDDVEVDLTEFEKFVFKVHSECLNDTGSVPMDMTPNFVVWSKIPCFKPKTVDFEHNWWFKQLYPELNTKSEPFFYNELAQKHVYQFHVRHDVFSPRMLLNLFHMDVGIEQAKFDAVTRCLNESAYFVKKAAKIAGETISLPAKLEKFRQQFMQISEASSEDFSLP